MAPAAMAMRAVEVLPGLLAWAPEADTCPPGLEGRVERMVGLCGQFAEGSQKAGTYRVPHYARGAAGRAFGPLALSDVLRFCMGLDSSIDQAKFEGERVILTTPIGDKEYRANSAVLLGAYLVLRHGWTVGRLRDELGAQDAEARFACSWSPCNKPEESRVMCVDHCWQGLELARDYGWITKDQIVDKVKMQSACDLWESTALRYDAAWLVPGLIMVAADPTTVICDPNPATCESMFPKAGDITGTTMDEEDDNDDPLPDDLVSTDTVCKEYGDSAGALSDASTAVPEDKVDFTTFLQRNKIGLVVRANFNNEQGMPRKSYKDDAFEPYGITQANVQVADIQGGLPMRKDILRVLEHAEDFWDGHPKGAMLVHCKGGFGRSVVLACCLAIERLNLPGAALLGWVRMVRPGAVCTRKQELFLDHLHGRADLRRFAGLRADTGAKITSGSVHTTCTACSVQ